MFSQPNLELAGTPAAVKERRAGAIWTLVILAPLIAEVLTGSTRVSFIYVFIPEMMVWGGGALLCRELARRWHAGITSLLLLGLALSTAEEFLIQQTSLAPLPFPGANAVYARWWGVNWVYFLFMLGFESVWVVLVPVQTTELIFSRHRESSWLRTRGMIVTGIVLLLGCRIAWYGWTQQARKRLNAAPYDPPLAALACGAAAILVLILLAWLLRSHGQAESSTTRRAVPVLLPAIAAFILSAGWFSLMGLVFSPNPWLSATRAVIAAIAWGTASYLLFSYLAAARGWNDFHRWALCFASTLGTMSVTFMGTTGWSHVDLIGKIVLNLLSVAGFILLGLRIQKRAAAT